MGGRFPGSRLKISKKWAQIRIPGPKLPTWTIFYVDLMIFKNVTFPRGRSISGPWSQNIKKPTPDSNSWHQITYMGKFLFESGDF